MSKYIYACGHEQGSDATVDRQISAPCNDCHSLDEFAAHAMLLARSQGSDFEVVASTAYRLAAAMMKERAKIWEANKK